MAAGTLPITIEQGATFRLRLTMQSGGVPVDLTGYLARMQVRERVASTEPALSITTEDGGLTLGGEDGTIDILITDEQTAALGIRRGVYDLEVQAGPTGDVTRILQGKVTISREVTRGADA